MVERREACPEWRHDLAGWLVAQGPPEREAAFTAHLATCAACRAEADELLAIAAVVLAVEVESGIAPRSAPVDDEPSPELGDRIAARVARERRGQLGRRAVLAAVGAAAAAAVVVVALLVATGDDGPGAVDGERFAFRTLPAGVVADVTVGADEGHGSRVQLVAAGLDPDTTYALWLTPPGGGYAERVPAGTFRPDADGEVDVVLRCPLDAAEVGRVWASDQDGIVIDTNPA